MKIGFVLDDTLDSTDGVQQYVLTVAAWLIKQGHDVHYLVGQTTRTDLPNLHSLSRNVKVRFNGNRMSMPLPAGRAGIRALLGREKFDVLHIQVPYSPFMAGRVITSAPPATAIVGTFHVAPHSKLVTVANTMLAKGTRASLRRFTSMLSVSEAAQKFAKQTFGIDSRVVPNVVEAGRFASAQPAKLPGKGPVIVFLGRLVPRKGCMYLLKAVLRLRASHPNLRVYICGRGPLEPELREYVKVHQLDQIVKFAGYVSEADKPGYLKAADLAVFPSTGGESFGIVLLEAMAAKRPVVLGANNAGYSTVLGAYPELLFPASDAGALAAKISEYLTDPVRSDKARMWQADYVKQFDIELVGKQLVIEYETAISRRVKTN